MNQPLAVHDALPDLTSETARRDLARVVSALFDRWQLNAEDQLQLLGMSPESRKVLPQYRRGERALPGNRDSLDRVGYLLGIHKALRLLFPENPEHRYSWVHRRNAALEGRAPLEVMVGEGMLGLAKVRRLLDFQRGQ